MAMRQKEHRLVGQQRAVALDHALGEYPDRLAIARSLLFISSIPIRLMRVRSGKSIPTLKDAGSSAN
jgi:hypothetical protein